MWVTWITWDLQQQKKTFNLKLDYFHQETKTFSYLPQLWSSYQNLKELFTKEIYLKILVKV